MISLIEIMGFRTKSQISYSFQMLIDLSLALRAYFVERLICSAISFLIALSFKAPAAVEPYITPH